MSYIAVKCCINVSYKEFNIVTYFGGITVLYVLKEGMSAYFTHEFVVCEMKF